MPTGIAQIEFLVRLSILPIWKVNLRDSNEKGWHRQCGFDRAKVCRTSAGPARGLVPASTVECGHGKCGFRDRARTGDLELSFCVYMCVCRDQVYCGTGNADRKFAACCRPLQDRFLARDGHAGLYRDMA